MASPHIEISNDFFHDSLDFLHRYRLTVESFYAVKSKRMKLFLDLRMAAECIMKAYSAYFLPETMDRLEVVKRVEKFSHKIGQLATDIKVHVAPELWANFEPFVQPLDDLPVGLRYRLDGGDFRELNEEFYYATVGSDDWLDQLHDTLKAIAEALNKKLQSHSRILSGEALRAEILRPRQNKFTKKAKQ